MRFDRRTALMGGMALGLASRAAGQTAAPATPTSPHLTFPDPTETIDLWPAGAPGAPETLPIETVKERSTDPAFNDRYVFGISRPRLAVFRPENPNGAAVMITPGGGYSWVVVDKEGYEMARWLNGHGITVFVLFYRLPYEGWAAGPDVALSDAQRAMRLIRHRADAYGLDPKRVAAMGFSAGGHLCADLMTRFDASVYDPVDAADRLSARPDAAAPIYPVISMTAPTAHAGSRKNLIGESASPAIERAHTPSFNVPADAPAAFLLHAEDDGSVVVENTLMLRAALHERGIATETHLYADGGHGFGLRLAKGKTVEGWEHLFHRWGRGQGLWA
ncbi:alpha/beta hydrolase [Pelagerythrobacter aerophilus]|uniref:Alpha/beta hydrolase n=1 Tax=Pelagerythrobacter aerophilus TaxID=2306995 RepID=A0A418NF81_9SPHN|nr:alpha/beta hydrolase [Pelagerythrobacter aerophilus]RIV76984.1 alpha/beta hydrolase [Pelagerythrobacter aerophilus]